MTDERSSSSIVTETVSEPQTVVVGDTGAKISILSILTIQTTESITFLKYRSCRYRSRDVGIFFIFDKPRG